MVTRRFSGDILAILRKSNLRIRAGKGTHRFIGIWVVVVHDRVFVRSWSLKRQGWYRTFLEDSRGSVQVGDREIPIRQLFGEERGGRSFNTGKPRPRTR